MKEPFVPKSTICQMLPLGLRREFFRRICPPWGAMRYLEQRHTLTIADILNAHRKLTTRWPAHVPAVRGK